LVVGRIPGRTTAIITAVIMAALVTAGMGTRAGVAAPGTVVAEGATAAAAIDARDAKSPLRGSRPQR
jgi:hypothetical protein